MSANAAAAKLLACALFAYSQLVLLLAQRAKQCIMKRNFLLAHLQHITPVQLLFGYFLLLVFIGIVCRVLFGS